MIDYADVSRTFQGYNVVMLISAACKVAENTNIDSQRTAGTQRGPLNIAAAVLLAPPIPTEAIAL